MTYSLRDISNLCSCAELAPEVISFIELRIPGVSCRGHMKSERCSTIFFQDPRSSVTRIRQSLQLDQIWGDRSVMAAFLDFDEHGKAIAMDIIC